jgi:lipopolysaccharide transport protein LptA
MSRLFFIVSVVFILNHAPANAQALFSSSDQPISIEASTALEWLRDQNMYRATKDVVITQGDTVLSGDRAEALYDPVQGPSALQKMTLEGGVRIVQKDTRITADKAIYNVQEKNIILQGKKITLQAPNGTSTTQGEVTYAIDTRQADMLGKTKIVQQTQTIEANTMRVWFSEKDNKIVRANADGQVIITREFPDGKDVALAQHAQYNAEKKTILLQGDVKIARGKNFMQGSRAEIDLQRGYSRLINETQNGQSTGRVRAVFTPSGQTKNNAQKPVNNQDLLIPTIPAKNNPELPYHVAPLPKNNAK